MAGYKYQSIQDSNSKIKFDPIENTQASISSRHNSIRVILSQCSTCALVYLFFIICLNIIAAIIPLLYYISLSKAIQEMGESYEDKSSYYEETRDICILLFVFGGIYLLIGTLAGFSILTFSRTQGCLWRKKYFKSLLDQRPEFYDLHPEAASGSNIEWGMPPNRRSLRRRFNDANIWTVSFRRSMDTVNDLQY